MSFVMMRQRVACCASTSACRHRRPAACALHARSVYVVHATTTSSRLRVRAADAARRAPLVAGCRRRRRHHHELVAHAGQRRPLRASSDDELASVAEEEKRVDESLLPLLAWVGAASAFGGVVGVLQGGAKASEYFAGYLLEQSLSVDNLIVFVLIFGFFQVPTKLQPRVLNYGVWGAGVLRLVFILLGAEALERFEPLLLFFAAILIFSSYKILSGSGDNGEDESLSDNAIVKLCTSTINSTDEYDGDRFFNDAKQATPLLLALVVIELSDVVFAVDSVPAIFGVTRDPFIVYTSSMFAILSLRAVFKAFAAYIDELHYLETAVGLVLGFIGGKMVAEYVGVEVSTATSLAVVATTLAGGIVASYVLPNPDEDKAKEEEEEEGV